MEARRFFLDTQARSFVAAPSNTLVASSPLFFEEDVESIELYFLRPTGNFSSPYDYLDYSSNTVKFAVGATTPAALQASWTALPTICTASVTTLTTGGGGSNEVQKIAFSTLPATGSFSITLPARAVTVSSVSAGIFTATSHGLLDGQIATLSAFTISGSTFANQAYYITQRTPDTFRIAATAGGTAIAAEVTSGGGTATLAAITTGQIASNATSATVQDAFLSAGISVSGAPQINVSGNFGSGFILTFANTQANINFDAVVVSSTLAAAPGLTANVSFSTAEVAALIAAGTTSVKLEIEVAGDGKRQTYQTQVTLSSDIISSTSSQPLELTTSSGFLLMSPNGSVWEISADDDGLMQAASSIATGGPSGIAVRSPNGTAFTLSVDNDGHLTTV